MMMRLDDNGDQPARLSKLTEPDARFERHGWHSSRQRDIFTFSQLRPGQSESIGGRGTSRGASLSDTSKCLRWPWNSDKAIRFMNSRIRYWPPCRSRFIICHYFALIRVLRSFVEGPFREQRVFPAHHMRTGSVIPNGFIDKCARVAFEIPDLYLEIYLEYTRIHR